MINEQRVILHLNLIENIGSTTGIKLVQACKRVEITLAELYNFSISDFTALGLPVERATALRQGLANQQVLDAELALINKHQIRVIFYNDPEYPCFLKNTHMPPLLLYVCGGAVPLGDHSIAIVGSRHGTNYGRACIEKIMPSIADKNWAVISGGARGIDAMAHESAITAGVQTVVVLGSGLLQPYPFEHKKLFDRIVSLGGCVISSFALNKIPDAWHFPARNRIIAGLSRGVIVVQAARKSGAHSTALFALEYGREVFAVPGLVDDPLSAGCHWLLQQGAHVLTGAEDLWRELDPESLKTTRVAPVRQIRDSLLKDGTGRQESILGPREQIIALCHDGACVDDIVFALNLPLDRVHQEVFTLQLDGVIHQDFSGLYRVRR